MEEELSGLHRFRFKSSKELLLELQRSRRTAVCLYRALDKEYVAQAENSLDQDGSHQLMCPQMPIDQVSDGSAVFEEVSLVASDIEGASYTNMTSKPCLPSSQLSA
jgi:hypothetical protein